MKISKNFNICVPGGKGMVGSSIIRRLRDNGYNNIIEIDRSVDLRNQNNVKEFFNDTSIDYVIICAAKVGGIVSNSNLPVDYLYDNLMIQSNIIHEAYNAGINDLLFLGSSCIYPKHVAQPIKEEYLLSGPLEETNLGYALAKITGIKMCESYNRQYKTDYRSVMPTNLYGINDTYDLIHSHVIPALIMKIYDAYINNKASVTIWGTGNAKREFMHVDDLASACLHVMCLSHEELLNITSEDCSHINIGVGFDITIKKLVFLIADIIGFGGEFIFDESKPDGVPRKLLDNSRLESSGWFKTIELKEGLSQVIIDYINNLKQF